MKKLSLQMRLTLLSVLLLTLCCAGLTFMLNRNANTMANTIEAATVQPAIRSEQEEAPLGFPNEDTELPPAGALPEGTGLVLSSESQQARVDFHRSSVLYLLLIIFAGGITTWFVVGRALRPLNTLSRRMSSCTVNNLSQQLPVPQSHDEVAKLTISFNQMSGKLNEAFAIQRRFSQSAAHELRTPLTVLQTKVDVFRKRRDHTREDYDKLIDGVAAQTQRLSNLVRDLLELTNLDGVTQWERISLGKLLKQVISDLAILAEEKQVSLSLEGTDACTFGNRELLSRVFSNLVENAIKYNYPGGSVRVTLENGPVVTVSDTGIGIPEDAVDSIFEPFFRVDKSRSRQMGGAGLGLATAKAIVEQHGGTIEVSTSPEDGSRFTVRLSE